MRVVLPLIALLLTTGAGVPQTVQDQSPHSNSIRGPVVGTEGFIPACRDRIQEVRRELGQPALDRNASPQDPLFIAAVDKRIGGCSVLVMRNDTSDIRPLPEPQELRLMPAR